MGAFISWLLTGGATAALNVGGDVINKVIAPIAQSKTDTHRIDTEAATQVAVTQSAADVQVATLDQVIALEDSKHVVTAWMRPAAFAMSLIVFALVIVGAKLPRLAALLSISNNDLPGYWSYLPIGIITAVVVLRPWEKNKSAQNTATMQRTIAQALPLPWTR
jgi:hypothetical protein